MTQHYVKTGAVKVGDRIAYKKFATNTTYRGVVIESDPDYLIVEDEDGQRWWEARHLFISFKVTS